jgi:hypothetical protein
LALEAVDAEPSQSDHSVIRSEARRRGAQTAGLNTVLVGERGSVEESDVTPELTGGSTAELATSLRGVEG